MSVLDFFNRIFGQPSSSQTAKERLRLVLLSDHLALAPDVVESLKHDLIDVISRYLEVDVAKCDVTFEREDKQVAMLANIPILGMQPRPPARHVPSEPPVAPTVQPPVANAAPSMAVTNEATPRKRRRRKRTAPRTLPQPG